MVNPSVYTQNIVTAGTDCIYAIYNEINIIKIEFI